LLHGKREGLRVRDHNLAAAAFAHLLDQVVAQSECRLRARGIDDAGKCVTE